MPLEKRQRRYALLKAFSHLFLNSQFRTCYSFSMIGQPLNCYTQSLSCYDLACTLRWYVSLALNSGTKERDVQKGPGNDPKGKYESMTLSLGLRLPLEASQAMSQACASVTSQSPHFVFKGVCDKIALLNRHQSCMISSSSSCNPSR